MSGVATAIAASAVIGGVVSNKASKDANKATTEAAATATEYNQQAVDQARADLQSLYPAAQANITQGYQSAADVFGNAIPAQVDAFTQGNQAAQQAILSGMPQYQNAILGNAIDYSQMTPQQQTVPDLSFLQNATMNAVNPIAESEVMGPLLGGTSISSGFYTPPPITGGGITNNSRYNYSK